MEIEWPWNALFHKRSDKGLHSTGGLRPGVLEPLVRQAFAWSAECSSGRLLRAEPSVIRWTCPDRSPPLRAQDEMARHQDHEQDAGGDGRPDPGIPVSHQHRPMGRNTGRSQRRRAITEVFDGVPRARKDHEGRGGGEHCQDDQEKQERAAHRMPVGRNVHGMPTGLQVHSIVGHAIARGVSTGRGPAQTGGNEPDCGSVKMRS
jgi:hypothetical protein